MIDGNELFRMLEGRTHDERSGMLFREGYLTADSLDYWIDGRDDAKNSEG